MKRNIYPDTGTAVAWWAANPNALKADCFSIALPNGQTIYVTEGQFDLTVPASLSPTGVAITFKATQYGRWGRGKITSEASFQCASNSMDLTLIPQIGTSYPGMSLSILNAVFNHLFDGATVWVWTAWMPFGGYGSVQVFETKFQGRMTEVPDESRVQVKFKVADPFFLLGQKVPSRLLQSNCYKAFADSNCGLNPANYTVTFTAKTGSTQTSLVPVTAFSQPDGYFDGGVMTCLTGENAGLSATVKALKGGVISMVVPWLLPVAAGDTFSVIKGCDLTPTTCAGMIRADGTAESDNWQTRFGGEPFMPPPSTAI